MKIGLIAAVSKNGVIGNKNDLPWHLPDDFAYFKRITNNHVVIMGRKNFQSLPDKFRPLPNRTNIILTRNKEFSAEGVKIVHTWEEAVEKVKEISNSAVCFVIGGGEIYALALPVADYLFLTHIDAEIEGDTYFPPFDTDTWEPISLLHHRSDTKHPFAFNFMVYQRKKKS